MTENQYYLTTSARTGKMMAIMLGICIVGGAIFFSLWDYWISEYAPVVAMMAGDSTPVVAVHTGELSHLISHLSNLRTLSLWHLFT